MRVVQSGTSADDLVFDTWSVEHAPHGAHICAFYEEPTQEFATSVPFIRAGLGRGDRCVYVYAGETLARVKRALRAGGIDVLREQHRGALAFVKPDEYVPRGASPETALDLLTRRTEEAKTAGFAGLGVAAVRRCFDGRDVDLHWARQFEALSALRLRRLGATVVCLFNPRSIPPDLLVESCRLHTWVAFGEEVLPNPSYEPPEHILGTPSAEARADWQLKRIAAMHALVQACRQQLQQFSVMAEHSPDAIASFDPDLRLRYVNPVMQLVLGQTLGQLLGHTIPEIGLPGHTARRWDLALRQVLRSRQNVSFIFQLQTPMGERFSQACLAPHFGPDDRVLGIVAACRDVTDLIQDQRAREHLHDAIAARIGELETLVLHALGGPGREIRQRQFAQLVSELRPREVSILRLVAQGHSNREIAEALHLSSGTVKNYVGGMLDKLGASNRAEAAARAAELGLLGDGST